MKKKPVRTPTSIERLILGTNLGEVPQLLPGILMGIRLSILDVFQIGAWGIPIVVVVVLSGLLITTYFSRLLRLPERLGTLIAVGTSICGATAIVAAARSGR